MRHWCGYCCICIRDGKVRIKDTMHTEFISNHSPKKKHIHCQVFTYEELYVVTEGFRADRFLGEGGFGKVYKGMMDGTNQVIFRATYWIRQWSLMHKEEERSSFKRGCRNLETLIMAVFKKFGWSFWNRIEA